MPPPIADVPVGHCAPPKAVTARRVAPVCVVITYFAGLCPQIANADICSSRSLPFQITARYLRCDIGKALSTRRRPRRLVEKTPPLSSTVFGGQIAVACDCVCAGWPRSRTGSSSSAACLRRSPGSPRSDVAVRIVVVAGLPVVSPLGADVLMSCPMPRTRRKKRHRRPTSPCRSGSYRAARIERPVRRRDRRLDRW